MTDDNDSGRPGRPPLTLKPRTGSVSAGVVKQSFSHGRSKTVVVETKRARTHTPGGNLAGPSNSEKRQGFDVRGPAPPRPAGAPPSSPSSAGGLSAEEMSKRQGAIDLARQQAERQAAERRAREDAEAAARRAEEARNAPPPKTALGHPVDEL